MEAVVEALIEAQDIINPEVGEDLPLGEGEDLQIEKLEEIENIENGMKNRPLGQGLGLDPTMNSKGGRKDPGQTMMNMSQNNTEITTETKTSHVQNILLLNMWIGREPEAPVVRVDMYFRWIFIFIFCFLLFWGLIGPKNTKKSQFFSTPLGTFLSL